jgi:hypothetical protein
MTSVAEQEALFEQFRQVWVDSTVDDRQIVQLAHVANVRYPTAWNAIPYLRRAAELRSDSEVVNQAVRVALDTVETEHALAERKGTSPNSDQREATRARIYAIAEASSFHQQLLQLEAAVTAYFQKELSGVALHPLSRAMDLGHALTVPLVREFARIKGRGTELLVQDMFRQGDGQVAEINRLLVEWHVDQFLEFAKTLKEPEWTPPTYSSGDRHYWPLANFDSE